MPAHFPYLSPNPFRLCDIGAAASLADLRREAKRTAKAVAVGFDTPAALAPLFGTDDAAQVEAVAQGLTTDTDARMLYRIFWLLAYKHPSVLLGETVNTLADLDALADAEHGAAFTAQTRFLRAWYGFLLAPTAAALTLALDGFDTFYNDAACDAEFLRLLENEKVRESPEAVLERAHQSALGIVLGTGVQTAARFWQEGNHAEAQQVLTAITKASFPDDTLDKYLRNFAPVGDRFAADVLRINNELKELPLGMVQPLFEEARRLKKLATVLVGRVAVAGDWNDLAETFGNNIAVVLSNHAHDCINKNDLAQSRAMFKILLKEPLAHELHTQSRIGLSELDKIAKLDKIEAESKSHTRYNRKIKSEVTQDGEEAKKMNWKAGVWVAVLLLFGVFYVCSLMLGPTADTMKSDTEASISAPATTSEMQGAPLSDSGGGTTIIDVATAETQQQERIERLKSEFDQLDSEITATDDKMTLQLEALHAQQSLSDSEAERIEKQRVFLNTLSKAAVRQFNDDVDNYNDRLRKIRRTRAEYNGDVERVNIKIRRQKEVVKALNESRGK